jgi:hypothetical protein
VARKTPRDKQSKASVVMTTAAAASWMALLAATTTGMGNVQRVRAEVSADIPQGSRPTDGSAYRLIVQSYSRGALAQGDLPSANIKPIASAQRAITLEELANGVAVDVLGVGEAPVDDAVVVAWVEPGKPDLEFDALRARPAFDAIYGSADAPLSATPRAQVVLRRRS